VLTKLGPGRAVLGSTWDKTPWQPRHYVSEVETDLAELGKSPLRRVAQPQRAELMYALPQAVRHGRFGCLLLFCVDLLNLVLSKENEGVSVVLRCGYSLAHGQAHVVVVEHREGSADRFVGVLDTA
jgi:hypothetical protein